MMWRPDKTAGLVILLLLAAGIVLSGCARCDEDKGLATWHCFST